MMQRTFVIALAAFGLVTQALAYENRSPESWERENAWRLSTTPDSPIHAAQLRQLVHAGDKRGTLAYLQSMDRDPQLPAPARERLYLEFVNALRQEAPRTVDQAVLDYLFAYPVTVFVPDEDHPRNSVPLFNVHSATAGLDNTWTREEAVVRGASLIQRGPRYLVNAYSGANNEAERRGLLDALSNASGPQRQAIAEASLDEVETHAELAEVAGNAALLNEDSDLLEHLLARTHGNGVHRLLRSSATQFSPEQNARLLDAALDSGSSETAALAIAELSPVLAGRPASVDRIFALLGDRGTGSAAARALAGVADPVIVTRLETIGSDNSQPLAAARAQMALQWIDDALVREVK